MKNMYTRGTIPAKLCDACRLFDRRKFFKVCVYYDCDFVDSFRTEEEAKIFVDDMKNDVNSGYSNVGHVWSIHIRDDND